MPIALTLLLVAFAAQPMPKVHLIYPPPTGTVFDRNCTQTLAGSPVIDPAWVAEAVQRAPEFQARWDREGPAYLQATYDEIPMPFPFVEMQAALSVCPVASMSAPLILNVRNFLKSATRPTPDFMLSVVLYHELMHTYTRAANAASGLRKKYASEDVVMLNHLHVLALEKFVLLKVGKKSELAYVDRRYRESSPPAYKRAWEIVNDIEGHDAFIKDLKAYAQTAPRRGQ